MVREVSIMEAMKKHAQKRTSSERDNETSQETKKKRGYKYGEERVPTAQEMRELKTAEKNSHTSLCQMQMTALLAEVRVKKKHHTQRMEAVERLKEICCQLPREKTELPAPADIFLGGSFPQNTCVQPTKAADVVIVMPKEYFGSKDYLNHRYLQKRLKYLAGVADLLKDFASDIKFTYRSGNPYQPILVIRVSVSGSSRPVVLHLHTIPEDGIFRPAHFCLSKNNVRPRWFSGIAAEAYVLPDGKESWPATPYYNTSILQDVCLKANTEWLSQQLSGSPSLQDGVALFKVWLHQRELDVGFGSCNGFVAAMYMGYLLSQKVLNQNMNSYQILRHTLTTLSLSDWEKTAITLCSETGNGGRPSLEEFKQHFDVVFVDVTGFVNICLGMTSSAYKRVRHEAAVAIQCLTTEGSNIFDLVLMAPVPFSLKFDAIFHISYTKDLLLGIVKKHQLSQQVLDLGAHLVPVVTPTLLDLIVRGLGDRAELVYVQPLAPPEWSVCENQTRVVADGTLTFGLLLREAKALNIVDRGPKADSDEAAKFREFWGEKSELRRFQDGGSIVEAIKWAASTSLNKRRAVCRKIVSYILHRHADIDPKWVHHVGHQVEQVLHNPHHFFAQMDQRKGGKDGQSDLESSYGTGEECHYHVRKSLEELSQMLRSLPGLPLSINMVSGISPVCRFTEVFPPCPANPVLTRLSLLKSSNPKRVPLYTPTVEVICKLEGSGKWPEDVEAIRRLKAAHCAKLGQELTATHGLLVDVAATHLDVLKDGYVFRLKLGLTREIGVLRMTRSPDGALRMEDTPGALALEAEITTLPRLTGWLQGIQQGHQSFCAVVRLVKRWLSAQLLLCHIPELTVEKTVARLYTQPLPFTAPVSPVAGLLRYLKFVSSDNYKLEDFTEKSWPLPPFIITNRLQVVAAASFGILQEQMMKVDADWKVIFRPPLEGYDIVVNLRPELLPRRHQAVDSRQSKVKAIAKYRGPRKTQLQDAEEMPVTDFDPAALLIEELKLAFEETGLIFHDQYGGDVIGILWKPGVQEEKEFKVPNMTARKPVISSSSNIGLELNLQAIADDIRVLGGGLVSQVQIRKKGTKL